MNLLIRDGAHILQFLQNNWILQNTPERIQHGRSQLLLLLLIILIIFIIRVIKVQQFLIKPPLLTLLILQQLQDFL